MAISLTMSYRAAKAHLCFAYGTDVDKYLSGFVGDDLRTLGLPMPHECLLKAYRTGRVRCRWYVEDGTALHRQISQVFYDVRKYPSPLIDLLIVCLEFQEGNKHSVFAFPPATPKWKGSKASKSFVRAPVASSSGKAPSMPKSTFIARHAASPFARLPSSHPSTTQSRPWSSHMRDPPGSAASSTKASSSEYAASTSSYTIELPAATSTPPSTRRWGSSSARSQDVVVPKVEEESHEAILGGALSDPRPPQATIDSSHRSAFPSPASPRIPSRSSASHGSSPPPSVFSPATIHSTSKSDMGALTREVWDVRREITALRERETSLMQRLEWAKNSDPQAKPLRRERPWTPEASVEDEVAALRAQLKVETETRHAAEMALRAERRRRDFAERVVADARRECVAPFVVPALMDALIKIAEFSDGVVAGGR